MRRGHRQMHARLWLALAVLLPVAVVLAIALSGRPPADPNIGAILQSGAED